MFEQDLFELDEEFQNAVVNHAKHQEIQIQARAIKVKNKIFARRASSEARLAEILPSSFEDGESWHVLSAGDIDSLSYLAHILKNLTLDYCMFSTWCMAIADVREIESWCESGKIKKLDGYVGEIFPNQYGEEYEELERVIKKTGGRICVFRNHSKIFLCKSGDKHIVIQSSANINTNPRCENTVITVSKNLFDHHKAYFDSVQSFDKRHRSLKISP